MYIYIVLQLGRTVGQVCANLERGTDPVYVFYIVLNITYIQIMSSHLEQILLKLIRLKFKSALNWNHCFMFTKRIQRRFILGYSVGFFHLVALFSSKNSVL